jgi:hypothetical protein
MRPERSRPAGFETQETLLAEVRKLRAEVSAQGVELERLRALLEPPTQDPAVDTTDARVAMTLHACFGSRPITAKQAMTSAKSTPALRDALHASSVYSPHELGWRLKHLEATGGAGGVDVQRAGRARAGWRWRLVRKARISS